MAVHRRALFFFLFALSGFSGLIYESIWTHYLKLFLGHAAYAQTLVLAIFMGGMAAGSWICSVSSPRWRNVLLGYALAEGVIGVLALVFHPLFAGAIDFSYLTVIPRLGSPLLVSAFKWGVSALLILPQSILLGTTFPLMSAGIIRRFPEEPGRSIALLYFTNSIGAAIGVLVSGFLLIRLAGLPGTIGTAGIINLLLAVTVWRLVKADCSPERETRGGRKREMTTARPVDARYRFFLLASLVTGAASFIYEIGWIRMLNLVLGSSTHAFELMLSAFILGLALGGLWVQRRIDALGRPVSFLARVQVVMGILALASLLLYGNTFKVMQWLVLNLSKTTGGYALFTLSSSAISMAIMLPATFCAGMTLPLITAILLRQGQGERAIGAVYAANTVGAIIGVFFSIHLGMPLLGLKGLITIGAGLDIALGFALLWSRAAEERGYTLRSAITAAGCCAVAATVLFVTLDPYKMGSGIYRSGVLNTPALSTLLYHRDGKTATISCFLNKLGVMSIRTNGKIDAGILMTGGEASGDEATTVLLAAIPMALNPHARTAAAIGLGSGLTSQTLLSNPRIEKVDTVEIEKDVVEAARNFGERVKLVYSDPRSTVTIEDAKTFFSTHKRKYDIIVSEPSNPWVSGVAGLFSDEFYRQIRNSMAEDGLFVQWVQLYEINPELVVSVLKAVSANFSDFAVYASNNNDMMVVARKNGLLPGPDMEALRTPALASALKRVHVEGEQDIEIRKIGTKKFYSPLLASFSVRANSDYHPVLDQHAEQARFLGGTARDLVDFTRTPLPVLAILTGEEPSWKETKVIPSQAYEPSRSAALAAAVRDYLLSGRVDKDYRANTVMQEAVRLRQLFSGHGPTLSENDRLKCLSVTALNIIPYLTQHELDAIWNRLESGHAEARLSGQDRLWYESFKAVGRRDARGMTASSEALLSKSASGGWSSGALKYLVATNMLGSLLQGNNEESLRTWNTYQVAIFSDKKPDLLFRMLASMSAAGNSISDR